MLAESRMMVPDCHKRLESALADLKGTLVLAFHSSLFCFYEELDFRRLSARAQFFLVY